MSNLVVATNIAALKSHRSLKVVSERSGKASEKLSSGLRINKAADDAAGLAISEKMRAQINGLNQAQRNVTDGISLIQTADAGMNEIAEMIKRQRELVIQGMNDTNTLEDRHKIHNELNQLNAEITATAERCEFNTIPLLTVGNDELVGSSYTAAQGITAVGNMGDSVNFTGVAPAGTVTSVATVTVAAGDRANINQWLGSNVTMRLTAPDGTVIEYSGTGANFTVTWPDGATSIGGTSGGVVDKPNSLGCVIYGSYGDLWFSDLDKPVSFEIEIDNQSGVPFDIDTDFRVYGKEQEDGGPVWVQSGANENQGMWVDRYDCRARALGIDYLVTTPVSEAEKSLDKLDTAMEKINSNRAKAGAQQNRLESASKSLGISSENLSAAESRIRDADMAKEMMEFTKGNILSQAGTAMLAQANQAPNRVLSLLQN